MWNQSAKQTSYSSICVLVGGRRCGRWAMTSPARLFSTSLIDSSVKPITWRRGMAPGLPDNTAHAHGVHGWAFSRWKGDALSQSLPAAVGLPSQGRSPSLATHASFNTLIRPHSAKEALDALAGLRALRGSQLGHLDHAAAQALAAQLPRSYPACRWHAGPAQQVGQHLALPQRNTRSSATLWLYVMLSPHAMTLHAGGPHMRAGSGINLQ